MMTINIIILLLVTIFPLNKTEKICRLNTGENFNELEFARKSCSACYEFSPAFKIKSLTKEELQNVTYPDMMDDADILASFANDKGRQGWQTCCRKAVDCCHQQPSQSNISDNLSCPATWDGWQCWNKTKSGTTVQSNCPNYIFKCQSGMVAKKCQPDGNWFRHPKTAKEWTDYSQCSHSNPLTGAIKVSIASFTISLVALAPALYIFYKFSVLHCFRTVLHCNLFLSLLLHSIFKILMDTTISLPELSGQLVFSTNAPWCRLLTAINVFFVMSNYMWMMCEGLLLHRQLLNAFVEESHKWIFFAIGWGVPFICIIIIVILRLSLQDENCWTFSSNIDWGFLAPCLASLVINFGFFIYILFVVVRTLGRQTSDNFKQFRAGFRAGLVLVPLFGLHFVFTIYRPNPPCTIAEEYYTYVACAVEGLQGCLVAIIYCYINTDVKSALRRSYRNLSEKRKLAHVQMSCTNTTSTQTTI